MKEKKHKALFTSSSLIRHLRGLIRKGCFTAGGRLPSVRQLAQQFGVGRQVALYALCQLVRQRILVSVNRKGYFVNPEYQPDRFYRVGFLDNDINPLRNYNAPHLYTAALNFGIQLIPLNRFESDLTLEEVLKQFPDIDGVIITGRQITNKLLAPLSKGKLPYVVFGHYDISPLHPQVWFERGDVFNQYIADFIAEKKIKSAAIIAGPADSYADQRVISSLQGFLKQQNCQCRITAVHAAADGYAEVCTLLEAEEPPELLVFFGEHCMAYKQYAETHRGFKRPALMINEYWGIPVPSELVDSLIPRPLPQDYLEVMGRMLKQLHCL